MSAAAAILRLMFFRPVANARIQPEDAMCIEFADELRAATIEGRLRAVWIHPAQELCFGHKTGVRAAISRAMGMHVGVTDYVFLWADGSAALEAKHGRGKLTDSQSDFATWCAHLGIPHRVFRSAAEGLGELERLGVLS